MSGPDPAFWEQRFASGDLPWDRGAPNPQLSRWLLDGSLESGRIVVPGCGSGHEVEALARAGFEVTALDYADAAVTLTRSRLERSGLKAQTLRADVRHWRPATACDAIYEQTCLCALHPDDWSGYAAQLAAWLRPGGKMALLAMQVLRPGAREGRIEGPPFHIDINALRALFPGSNWTWPRPPYARVPHPSNAWGELALVLTRR